MSRLAVNVTPVCEMAEAPESTQIVRRAVDLYAEELGPLTFRRLYGGNNYEDGEDETCVVIAPI